MTDYTKPGEEGAIPEGFAVPRRSVVIHIRRRLALGRLLACGKPYIFEGRARQIVVTCDGYDFTRLYQAARGAVDRRIAELRCVHSGCGPKTTVDLERQWWCNDDRGEAGADVKVGVFCPNPDDRPAEGLDPVRPEQLTKPYQNRTDYEGDVYEAWDEDITKTDAVECDRSELCGLAVTEIVKSCDGINYKRFVERALDRAREYCDRITCEGDCVKAPFKWERVRWGCEQIFTISRVGVGVLFLVTCRRS